jgi:hypothetical protein
MNYRQKSKVKKLHAISCEKLPESLALSIFHYTADVKADSLPKSKPIHHQGFSAKTSFAT